MVEVTQVNAFEVAQYFIWLANNVSNPSYYFCPLKLQKLTFLAQGWYLALYDEPLFLEDFEAWSYGPVIRSLYRNYQVWGGQFIKISIEQPYLPFEIESFLKKIFNVFFCTSALDLSRITHETGSPWSITRNGLPLKASCSRVIPKLLIGEYYRNLINDSEENGDEENPLTLFLDFLTDDAESNFHSLILYTEDMLKKDKYLLEGIIDL